MACVVTEACINCRYGDCAEVCPVHAFHQGPNFMVIDPSVCLNCTICTLVCPVNAIKNDYDLTEKELGFVELNDKLARKWPVVKIGDGPLPDADDWAFLENKRALLV
ncbi:DUF3470 domain-containing protein [Cupriavidus basilensis]|uniref:Ferredoxin n=1 Tax=Cupriavidus basilensis TaxID=68895 RepID=A0A0C4YF41_9BURK|nr:DUF3470 domain-containing protein [Cupriavidus basilensis]AJG24392.1 4Fe-4S ferredoxin, iron-sulfur binding [Cupriavidus basilensis]